MGWPLHISLSSIPAKNCKNESQDELAASAKMLKQGRYYGHIFWFELRGSVLSQL